MKGEGGVIVVPVHFRSGSPRSVHPLLHQAPLRLHGNHYVGQLASEHFEGISAEYISRSQRPGAAHLHPGPLSPPPPPPLAALRVSGPRLQECRSRRSLFFSLLINKRPPSEAPPSNTFPNWTAAANQTPGSRYIDWRRSLNPAFHHWDCWRRGWRRVEKGGRG